MKTFIIFFCSIILFTSCLKENLDSGSLDKILMVQVDYKEYKFEGGKEFSYFENDTSTVFLPLTAEAETASPGVDGKLIMRYTNDTIFHGSSKWQNGSGEKLFPVNIDNQIHYEKLVNKMAIPDLDRFQVQFNDLTTVPINYDSIWLAVSKVKLINTYLMQNSKSKIGMFLYRPSQGVENPGDWKWYLVFKN